LPARYWVAWTLISVTGSVEVCLSLWAVEVLRGHAGMAPGQATAAVSGIVAGMFAGRLVGGRLLLGIGAPATIAGRKRGTGTALRVAPVPFLFAALGVSAVGFTIFWFATAGWLATAGLVVLGLGNAMHFPLGISLAMRTAPGREDLASARASYGFAVCFGVAPLVLGAVADGIGPHPAFLLVPVLLALAALLVFSLRSVAGPEVNQLRPQLVEQVP
jgi:fucose permease